MCNVEMAQFTLQLLLFGVASYVEGDHIESASDVARQIVSVYGSETAL